MSVPAAGKPGDLQAPHPELSKQKPLIFVVPQGEFSTGIIRRLSSRSTTARKAIIGSMIRDALLRALSAFFMLAQTQSVVSWSPFRHIRECRRLRVCI